MINQVIHTNKMEDPSGSFHPHARRVGDFIFVSGLIARTLGQPKIPGVLYDSNGNVVGHDVEQQFLATLENLKHVLDAAGTSVEHIVDVTIFLTDLEKDFKKFNAIYGKHLGHVNPARTTVQVPRLPSPVCIELKVIAVMPSL